jgi:putative membrane protein
MYFRHHGVAPFHPLFHVLFLLLVVAGIVWLIVLLTRGRFGSPSGGRAATAPTALETLDQRYARGDVSRDEYLQARSDLGGPAPSG